MWKAVAADVLGAGVLVACGGSRVCLQVRAVVRAARGGAGASSAGGLRRSAHLAALRRLVVSLRHRRSSVLPALSVAVRVGALAVDVLRLVVRSFRGRLRVRDRRVRTLLQPDLDNAESCSCECGGKNRPRGPAVTSLN